ncbi:MAG: hypothetical protein JKX72_02245 [Robiginitomaculum sp.]|nr:hypothetical protein [Robiginitomaculum sp.]
MSKKLIYNRVLLKISGEALMGQQSYGIDVAMTSKIAKEVADVHAKGVEIGLVIGGGNIFRGLSASAAGIERTTADYMGMLATIMNALAMQSALERIGLDTLTVDDFMFSPYGYSLNAIHHHDYLTIHITPQPHSSYVSIVASINILPLIPRFLATLAPKSFDIVTVNDNTSSTEVNGYMPATYRCKNHSAALLKSGYSMDYHNFTLV